jgi:DedD protein
MEKKKLLLVAVSVGVVLLILIGIPLMLLTPRQSSGSSWQTASPVETYPEYPRAIEAPDMTGFTGGVQNPVEVPSAITQVPVETPSVTTINVPTPRTVAVPDTPVRPAPAAARPAPRTTTAPAAPRPQPAARPAQRAEPAKAQTTQTNFWVQTGAFSTKVRAEGAKESLQAKGITSIIDNRDIDGKTWYRVRVGPYMSETEANYWLALVKSIDGFGESQVRQAQVLR